MEPVQSCSPAGRDVAICGSQASVSVAVCDTAVNMALDLIHLLIPHLSAPVAYGTMVLQSDGNVAKDRTFAL